MVERRSSLGLTVKRLRACESRRETIRKELQGNEAVELDVFRLVHHAHPTAAEFLQNAIVRDGVGQSWRGIRHWGRMLGCVQRQVNVRDTFALCIVEIRYGHMYAYLLLSMLMKRTALFLKEEQLEKLQTLSEKTGAPIAELVRRAIDVYLLSRKKELK